MASPATTALRAELVAALDVLMPQIRGLKDLVKIGTPSLSEQTLEFLRQELDDHTRRRDLCQAVLTTIDALDADDYPNMPVREVPPPVAADLKEQADDFAAAFAQFEAQPVVSTASTTFPAPTLKPSA